MGKNITGADKSSDAEVFELVESEALDVSKKDKEEMAKNLKEKKKKDSKKNSKNSKPKKEKYQRSKSERRKALLRDADDSNSELDQEARDFIKETNGKNVPEGYEVSHEVPLYTEKTIEGKKALDVADNMKTIPKKKHRSRHKACGDQFHDFPR